MKKYAIGADIGGSHISCAVIDLEKELIIKESLVTQKVNNQSSADEIINNWTLALKQSLTKIDRNDLAGIGFAMPGPFDYEKGVALFTHEVAKFEKLYGVNVAQQLSEMLSIDSSNVRFMNDATSFAVGEAWMGKAANVKRSVSITLGTGFGSAFVDAGFPVVEGNDVPVRGFASLLPFNNGIADDFFSTRWFIKRYAEKSKRQLDGVKEIADRYSFDDKAHEVFVEFGNNLGIFLGPWLKKFGADALVIGGNISAAYNLFSNYFEASLKNQRVTTKIYLSELKEDAALIGSARLFDDDFWNKVKPLLSKM